MNFVFGMRLNWVKPIPAESLTEALLRADRVWEFCNDDRMGDTLVRPVKRLPVTDSDCRLFAGEFTLADGSKIYGYLGNLSLRSKDQNQQFLTLSVFVGRGVVHLARYHDVDFARRGPAALAAKLGKVPIDVFPISFDVSDIARGNTDCVRGQIPAESLQKLSQDELMKLIFEDT
jgi:hypothetical protein